MYFPPPWHDVRNAYSYFGQNVETNMLSNVKRGYRGINYPLPQSTCRGRAPKCSGARLMGGANDWFTNYTFIPGQPTLPRNMYDTWSSDRKVEALQRRGHPWTSPGSAPTFGEGCGANGGNPYGCQRGDTYGSCCAQARRTCLCNANQLLT